MNENGNTTYEHLWNKAKAEFKENILALNSYIRKEVMLKINNLSFHIKQVGKEKNIKHKVNRRIEIIKIRNHQNGNKDVMEKTN